MRSFPSHEKITWSYLRQLRFSPIYAGESRGAPLCEHTAYTLKIKEHVLHKVYEVGLEFEVWSLVFDLFRYT